MGYDSDEADRLNQAYGEMIRMREPRRRESTGPHPDPLADRLIEALREIARGRSDNGRPLGGKDAQDIARTALIDIGSDWTKRGTSISIRNRGTDDGN